MFGKDSKKLSDKVHEFRLLVALRCGLAAGVDFLQQPGHVVAERAHGLHALFVELRLAFAGAVGDVPALGRDHGHVHHLEHQIARLVNEKSLYTRWDKQPVTGKQVYACVMAYPDTFVKSEGLIRLMI